MSILAALEAPEPAHRAETLGDTLWIYFYRALPVFVLVLVLLGIIK